MRHSRRIAAVLTAVALSAGAAAPLASAASHGNSPTTTVAGSTSLPLAGKDLAKARRTAQSRVAYAIITYDLLSKARVADLLGITLDRLNLELSSGISIKKAARAHGISSTVLVLAIRNDITTKLNALLAAGTITTAQHDVWSKAVPGRISSFINRVSGKTMNRTLRELRKALLKATSPVLNLTSVDVAATALGMTTAELKTQLDAGLSIAAVAAVRNVPVATVTTALTTDALAKIDAALAASKITQTQADLLKALVPALVYAFVNTASD